LTVGAETVILLESSQASPAYPSERSMNMKASERWAVGGPHEKHAVGFTHYQHFAGRKRKPVWRRGRPSRVPTSLLPVHHTEAWPKV